jgi:SAM-dependent methyltransferase
MAHLRAVARFLGQYAALLAQHRQLPNDDLFLRAAYHSLLKREPDEAGLQHYGSLLRAGSMTKQGVLQSILHSEEFRQVYGCVIHPLEALHRARVLLVQQCLPPADIILDLGGASHDHPEGALLVMGYPHQPQQITIVDLPPDERIGGSRHAEHSQAYVTSQGVRVIYRYRSMADLDDIPDSSVDLIMSGESIEHISESDADHVCSEAYRILRPGGSFCLDTPNAALTRMHSPDALTHPEHQKEYYPHEIRAKLEDAGLRIADARAICPMPESLASRVFDYREMARNVSLSDRPDEGYLFFFRAVKPSQG